MASKKTKSLTKKTADPHTLYELAVQDADATVDFIDSVFDDEYGREPVSLREDFCGTAKLCAEWVKRGRKRTAVGLDIDAPTLAWGKRNNIAPLSRDEKRRVELIKRDVLVGTRVLDFGHLGDLSWDRLSFQSDLQDFIHCFHKIDIYRLENILWNILEVFFILLRENDSLDFSTMRCQQLFLNSADGKDLAAQGDFAGHCHIFAHRYLGQG